MGRRLIQRLAAEGAEIVLVSRQSRIPGLPVGVQVAPWEHLETVLAGAGSIINLAGEGIADARWTPDRKQLLRSSRIDATTRLVEAIGRAAPRPVALVNASAIGIYDVRAESPVDEGSALGTGFLPDLCRDWEAAADAASVLGVRVVKLRIGVVLAREGGALPKMAAPVKLFLGAPLGHGSQGLSWIHIEDLVELLLRAAGDPAWEGAMNATAPESLPNAAFTRILGEALRRPIFPVPGWITAAAVKVLAGEMGKELLLSGAYVQPRRALEKGFAFRFPTAESALKNLLT